MTVPPKKKTNFRVRLLVAGVMLLLLVTGLLVLCSLEWIQHAVITEIAERAIDAKVDALGISLGNPLALERITVRDPNFLEGPPLLAASGLTLSHGWNPFSARPLRRLSLQHLELHLLDSGTATNYDFLLDQSSRKPDKARSMAYLPQSFQVNDVLLEMKRPAWDLLIEDIAAEGRLPSLNSFSARVVGLSTRLHWQAAGESQEVRGKIDVRAVADQGGLILNGIIDVPEVALLPLDASVSLTGRAFHLRAKEGEVYRAFWPPLLSDLAGLPVDFAALHLHDLLVEGRGAAMWDIDQARINAEVDGLVLGPAGSEIPPGIGKMEINTSREEGRVKIAATLDLPGVVVLDADGAITQGAGNKAFQVSIQRLNIKNAAVLDRFSAFLPYPLGADSVEITSTRLAGAVLSPGIEIEKAEVDARMQGFQLGPPDTPYYSGDLEVSGTGVYGKETRFDGTVQLAAGCPLGVQVYQTQEEARVELHVPELSRDQLQQNLPERFSVLLDHVPGLEVLQGEATATWHQPEYKVDIQLAPRLRGIKDTVKVSLAGGGATYTGPLFSGKLDAQTGTASIHAGLVFTSANDFTLDAVLDKVPVREWVRAWTEAPFPETLEAVASGTANVAASAEGYTATVELTALAPAYGEFRLPAESEAKLTGSATLSKDASAARDITMKLAIAESLAIQVSGGTFDLKTLGGAGALTGQADLGYLGAILSQPDLFGSVDISGPATLKGMDSLEIALRLESESLGYRDWATPYRMPLLVEGPVILSPAEQHVTGADIKIQLGETNRVQLGSFSLAGGETLTLEAADVHVESDLSPLAAMEWLSDAQAAHATLDAAKVQWDATGFSGDVNVLVEAARLALPKNVASLEAAYGEGQFTYQSGFTGEGRLEARRILAGGVSAEGINSTVRGEGPDLVLEKIQSALFDGSVAGSVRLGLAREQLAVEVALQLENIDLAAFTAQFKPPGITLTGRSSGTAFVVFGRDGMKDFKADLSAGEGFSLNRDMVERVLLSQYIGEVSGGKKAQKWVEKVIGKAQQRPFDSATLNLGFKDNKIVGVILLKSKDLNYTVDVTADPESLVEALRLRQEERTSTSTVQ